MTFLILCGLINPTLSLSLDMYVGRYNTPLNYLIDYNVVCRYVCLLSVCAMADKAATFCAIPVKLGCVPQTGAAPAAPEFAMDLCGGA